ncbi:MAG TPA: hypothetical protein PKN47_07780 [Nitrospira sp.]|nr:hypothetical protein [Nitrospira sp.]
MLTSTGGAAPIGAVVRLNASPRAKAIQTLLRVVPTALDTSMGCVDRIAMVNAVEVGMARPLLSAGRPAGLHETRIINAG